MFEYYTLGTQVQRDQLEDEPLCPKESPREERQPRASLPTSQQQPSPSSTMSAATNEKSPSTKYIDRLAHRMSKQSLRFQDDVFARQSTVEGASSTSSSSAPPLPYVAVEAPILEPDDNIDETDAEFDMDLDVILTETEMSRTFADPVRSRRQRDSLFTNNPSNSRAIESLIAGMIHSRYQCNVADAPIPAAPSDLSPSEQSQQITYISAPAIDSEDPLTLACGDLEVDEGFCDDEATSWQDSLTAVAQELQKTYVVPTGNSGLNVASLASSGVVKKRYPHLRYRTSQDAALNCPNIVRNVPRMRRRRGEKTRSKLRKDKEKQKEELPVSASTSASTSTPAMSYQLSSPVTALLTR